MYQLHSAAGSSHTILSGLVMRYARNPVLDVGADEGYLGRLLIGSGLVVDAIEPNVASGVAARPYYRRLYCTGIEDAEIEEQYGTIVCGDILEHLVDPLAALRRLMGQLMPNGILLISLPNTAHLAVRLLLLAGRFPQMDRGPLDRTHLHFYTRSTAEQMLRDAGLRIVDRRVSTVPLVDLVGARWRYLARALAPVQRGLVRIRPELFAYQWIFVTTTC